MLEVERNLGSQRARSYIVGAAEGREEVVQGVLVGDIDGCQIEINLVALGVEEVVFAEGGVKQVPRRDAWRVLVVVFGSRRGNADQGRTVLRGRAGCEARGRRCLNAVAGDACLKLLIVGEAAQINRRGVVRGKRD